MDHLDRKLGELKKAAEKRREELKSADPTPEMQPDELARLIGELEIHQIELEVQNQELRKTHLELRESRREFLELFEFAPTGYVTIDRRGYILKANLAAATLLGIPRIHLQATAFTHFLSLEYHDDFHRAIRESDERREARSVELKLRRPDASEQLVKAKISTASEGENNTAPIRIALSDIHPPETAEEKLRDNRKMAAIEQLAGGVAHQFNNIMSIILGNTELAVDTLTDHHPAREHLEEIFNASLRARDLVRQLLTFGCKTAQDMKPCRMAPIIHDTLREIQPTLPKHITLRSRIADALPPVCADSAQIRELLINLCRNAADAMAEKGGVITVGLDPMLLDDRMIGDYPELRPGQHVKLTIRDTGRGMAPAVMARIFEPFFTTESRATATGLGLAVVHGITVRHEGTIRVESAPGRGTTFTLLFPAAISAAASETFSAAKSLRGTERIMIVDDESAVLNLEKQRLARLGYDVVCFSNPAAALENFRNAPAGFDLVITDLTMPKMNGNRLATEILKLRPSIPIILFTGHIEKRFKDKALENDFAAVFTKPVDRVELTETIRRLMDREPPPPVNAA